MIPKKRAKFRSEEKWLAYCRREHLRNKNHQKTRYWNYRRLGICPRCSHHPCTINPHTHKPYWACRDCRIKHEIAKNRGKQKIHT